MIFIHVLDIFQNNEQKKKNNLKFVEVFNIMFVRKEGFACLPDVPINLQVIFTTILDLTVLGLYGFARKLFLN